MSYDVVLKKNQVDLWGFRAKKEEFNIHNANALKMLVVPSSYLHLDTKLMKCSQSDNGHQSIRVGDLCSIIRWYLLLQTIMTAVNDNLKQQFQLLQDQQQKKLALRKQELNEKNVCNSTSRSANSETSTAFGIDDNLDLQVGQLPSCHQWNAN